MTDTTTDERIEGRHAVRLEMSRPHARAVSEATEILARLGAGQVEVLVDLARSGLLPTLRADQAGLADRLDRIRHACTEIKAALGYASNEQLGIAHPRTPLAAKRAFEVKKSLDRALALDAGNPRGVTDIALDGNLVRYSGGPFPVTAVDGVTGDSLEEDRHTQVTPAF